MEAKEGFLRGWELFRTLVRGSGFYKRKLLFFSVAAVAVAGIIFIWQANRNVEAAIELPVPESSYTNQINLDVTITKDAQVTISGKKNNKVLKFYENSDELRIMVFNAPGYYVQNFRAIVHLPTAEATRVRPLIYAVNGVGSRQTSVLDSQTLEFEVTDISAQATVTIVADLPKGMVQPRFWQRIKFAVTTVPLTDWIYFAIGLPLITVILMAFMIFKRHSAQLFSASQISLAPPSKDPPAVAGVLVSGTVGAREIAATLVDLARRNFILIVNKGKGDFSFGKVRGGSFATMPGLLPFEGVLLDKIFLTYKSSLGDVEMRLGRHIFSRKIAQFYLDVYNFATTKGYFVKNPARVHLAYKYTGIVLLFLSLLGFAIGAATGADPKFGLLFWVGGMLAAFFVIRLSPFMPARSAFGTEELKKWLGFRKFLVSRKSLSAKEVLQSKFEEYLPLAIVLGVEVEWANRFLKEPFTCPRWYESAERVVTLESFVGEFFPFLGFVAENLAKSHEPTVE